MKTGIHPDYQECRVSCACGNEFVTRATKNVIKVEICAACHPFFTGEQRYVDTAGRVDKFRRRAALKAGKVATETKE
jgi:large subunit ribosomal protein L31